LLDEPQRHDDLANDPADRAFGFAHLKVLLSLSSGGIPRRRRIPPVEAPRISGSKFTLSSPLLQRRDSVC
jgi:hypothetical protein